MLRNQSLKFINLISHYMTSLIIDCPFEFINEFYLSINEKEVSGKEILELWPSYNRKKTLVLDSFLNRFSDYFAAWSILMTVSRKSCSSYH